MPRAPESPEVAPPASRLRPRLIFALKVVVTVLLLVWLARSSLLDAASLSVFVRNPRELALALVNWLVVSVFLSTLRWRVLLDVIGLRVSLGRGSALQLMALFFNGIVPGNVGGDLLKNLFVARDRPGARRRDLVLLVLLERAVGLAALVGVGAIFALLNAPRFLGDPRLVPLFGSIGLLSLAFLVVPLGCVLAMQTALYRRFVVEWREKHRLFEHVIDMLELVRTRRSRIALAFLVSAAMHASCIAYFAWLAHAHGGTLGPGVLGVIFPIGILSVVLPVSVGGFGVGHVAFEQLFRLVGASGGANVFNLYLVSQLAPSVIGVVPYLLESPSKRAAVTREGERLAEADRASERPSSE